MFWAGDSSSLPNNYYSALAQFKGKTLETRLDKNSGLKKKYSETLKEALDKGYVIPVTPHNPQLRSDREWFFPHRPVLNPNKPGKVRRILNGASKFHANP